MSVGAVVVAYRDVAATRACLESLTHMDAVVVVNVTADPAVAAAVEPSGRGLVSVPDNVGYGAGVNLGTAALPPEVDVVFFMNADVRLLSAWREPTPRGEFVYVPRQVGTDGGTLQTLSSLPTIKAFIKEWVLGLSGPSVAGGEPLPANVYANGAALLASRRVLEAHPLPEDYFLYWEEAAWFWRLADANRTAFMSDLEVERPSGRLEASSTKSYLMGKNLLRLSRERYGRPTDAVYACLGAIWLLRLLLTDVVHLDRRTRWRMRMHTFRGLMAGLTAGAAPERA